VTPERWARIREVFHAALEQPASSRAAFLEHCCAADAVLRQEVEKLLAAQSSPSLLSPGTELLVALADLASGEMIAQYRIDAKLGEGGMGAVYRAWDTRLHRDAALKVLPPGYMSDPDHKHRLLQEARAASGLNHAGIVTVYEIGCDSGVDYIAMEYVKGQSLAQDIPEKGLPLARALEYAIEIAAALSAAHAAGVVHRDLKPANIMLTGEDRVKLLDFGLAQRALQPEAETATLSAVSRISGTIGYMSPEQARGLATDRRSDLFSFGVVLYEMLTGERPFTGTSVMAVCDAILHDAPRGLGELPVPAKLKAIIGKLLEKAPADRYPNAGEVYRELSALQAAMAPPVPAILSCKAWIAVGAAAVLTIALVGWFGRQSYRQRWALETAVPEISRLEDAAKFGEAAALARRALAVLPKDPTIETLWKKATGEVTIETEPSGAEVSMRPYPGDPHPWEPIGKTPIQKLRLPRETYVWSITKAGFAPITYIRSPSGPLPLGAIGPFVVKWKLRPDGSVPPEMVFVPGGWTLVGYPLQSAPPVGVDSFLIDRHEVTNAEYKKFVDAGGYRKTDFWKQPFLKDGRTISWQEAVAMFHDATGRSGPATWDAGDFPKGQENYPVAGLSWFEAAAYAEFVGKSLPTAYHWMLASESWMLAPVIAAASNFRDGGPEPVGRVGRLSGFGTTDMAGNVKEWCWNEAANGNRLILGGGFGEPDYMFNHADAYSPWARRANFGFRCARYDGPPAAAAKAVISVPTRDYFKEKPVSDETFKAYAALYTYDKTNLNAQVEPLSSSGGFSQEKAIFDAAYNHERVTAYVFLPKNVSPPFQTLVYFPGGGAFSQDRLDPENVLDPYGFLLKSGRAFVVPVYKGMWERRDGFVAGRGNPPAFRRDHEIAWSKDLGRTLDYLETRGDIDRTKLAYVGYSAGGPEGAHLPAVDQRIKVAILLAAGFQLTIPYLPEGDPFNFAPHVHIPVLMVNGRYDATFPVETSQRALFEFLGTPAKDKKLVIVDAGHAELGTEGKHECLDWLDKYLGQVKR
jgi:predicted Ser/Thr protein kinase/dienelactone hydrolase